jgi:hypothetical protein
VSAPMQKEAASRRTGKILTAAMGRAMLVSQRRLDVLCMIEVCNESGAHFYQ